jgi:DNA-directed RNA polymerase specialized sigma24 family protein
VSLDVEQEPSPALSPFDNTAKAQGLRKLECFLASIDDDKRAVFVLTELEQMNAPEKAGPIRLLWQRVPRLRRNRLCAAIR